MNKNIILFGDLLVKVSIFNQNKELDKAKFMSDNNTIITSDLLIYDIKLKKKLTLNDIYNKYGAE